MYTFSIDPCYLILFDLTELTSTLVILSCFNLAQVLGTYNVNDLRDRWKLLACMNIKM
jgi:hypothetical protein